MIPEGENLIGRRFGRWAVLSYAPKIPHYTLLNVKCDCGTERPVRRDVLLRGKSKSCGCLASEETIKRLLKHGWFGTRLYHIWANMRYRCNKKTSKLYTKYGAVGIIVCKEWDKFESFKDWSLANGYNEKLTIDRINGKGNYDPSNCRWADYFTQNKNRDMSNYKLKRQQNKIKKNDQNILNGATNP